MKTQKTNPKKLGEKMLTYCKEKYNPFLVVQEFLKKHTKGIKKIVSLLLLGVILFQGCEVFNNEETRAYYHFRDTDFDKIPDYNVNQTLIFKNQHNDKHVFTITQKALFFDTNYNESSFGGMGFFTSSPSSSSRLFSYDEIIYRMNIENNQFSYSASIALKRFPIDLQKAIENNMQESPSEFTGKIKFPFWNGSNSDIMVDYQQGKTTLIINTKIYTNVIKIESDMAILNHPICNVNILYYDESFGLIAYDDLLGNNWKLQY